MKISYLLLALLISFASSSQKQKESKLEALVIITRHGARAPVMEDFIKEDWPGLNKGDLSQNGILQLQTLGKELREIYKDFLPDKWDSKFVKIKFSISLQRTLLSMLSLFHGAFPDLYGGDGQLNHMELMHPVKDIGFSLNHTDYDQRDLIFRTISASNCDLASKIIIKHEKEAKFITISKSFANHELLLSALQKLQEYRKSDTELAMSSMFHIKEVYDSYLCNKEGGKQLPKWSEEEIKFLQIQYEAFFFNYYCHRKARLISASAFFQEVFLFMEEIKNGTSIPKLFLFSGTKTNLVIIISSLLRKSQLIELRENKIAQLSAALIIEFEKSNEELFVTIKYAGKTLELFQCKQITQCTYKEFKILLKTRIIPDLAHTCDISKKKKVDEI